MEHMPQVFIEAEKEIEEKNKINQIDDTLYLLTSRLTKITGEITFACIPSEQTNYYLGLSNFLQKNTTLLGDEVYNVIKVLENKYNFIDLLKNLEI
jgi:hypothetical protein